MVTADDARVTNHTPERRNQYIVASSTITVIRRLCLGDTLLCICLGQWQTYVRLSVCLPYVKNASGSTTVYVNKATNLNLLIFHTRVLKDKTIFIIKI